MTESRQSALVEFVRFVVQVVVAVALLGALGYLPTRSFDIEGAIAAMVAALAAAGLGSIIGALPVLFGTWQGTASPQVVMVAMFVRLVAVAILAAFLVLTLGLELTPFLVWLALAYLLLLVIDTRYAAKALG